MLQNLQQKLCTVSGYSESILAHVLFNCDSPVRHPFDWLQSSP